ncbi:ABC transporter permease [Gracilibacillus saliphilus]|uniref:ABC transporter permease n=1 Tax=Gracilibacillus saliphilus TaxID=543890 RepID=UPI0013D6A65B|nr:ABC transporter permease [Gracilibacillus saliphilus]
MFFNVIYTELLKLKRSIILWILPIATIVPIILSFLPLYMTKLQEGEDANYLFTLLQGNLAFLNLIVGVPLFALIASYIFSMEYQQRTVNYLFTYPYSRLHFLLGKMTVILILMTFVIFSSFLISLGLGIGFLKASVDEEMLLHYLTIYLLVILMQFALIPLSILLTVWKKNILLPMFVSVILAVVAGLIMEYDIATLFPWSIPSRIAFSLTDYYNFASFSYNLSIVSLILVFYIPLMLSIGYYRKIDVH